MGEPRASRARGLEIYYGHRVAGAAAFDPLGPDAVNTLLSDRLEAWLDRRAEWQALSLEDLAGRSRAADRPGLMLTFDDGYRDNLTTALPLLEARGVPLLVFVTSGFIDRDCAPVESVLARLVRSVDSLRLPGDRALDCSTAASGTRAYESVRLQLKAGGVGGRDRMLAEILRLNPVPRAEADDTFLTWSELRELDRHPLVTIGAHTHTHPLLSRASWREAGREIRLSKTRLEEQLGHPVEAFAYPYGGHSLVVRRLVARAGFRFAFTTDERPVGGAVRRRPFRLPRHDLRLAAEREAA